MNLALKEKLRSVEPLHATTALISESTRLVKAILFARLLRSALSLMSQERKLLNVLLEGIQLMAKVVLLVMTVSSVWLVRVIVPLAKQATSRLLTNLLASVVRLESTVVSQLVAVSTVRSASLTTMLHSRVARLVPLIKERIVPEELVANAI